VYADTVFPYGNADAIEINAPPCNTDIPPEISHVFGPHHFEQPFVAEFRNGYIHETGVCLDSDGTVILDALSSRRDRFEQGFRDHPLRLLNLAKEQRRGLSAADRDLDVVCPFIFAPQFKVERPGGGFAGFIRKTLPLLEALEQYEDQTGNQIDILIPKGYPDKAVEALVFMGWDSERILRWVPGTRLRIDRLVVPSARSYQQLKSYRSWTLTRRLDRWYNSVAPSAYHWTRKRARSQLAEKPTQNRYSNKIYISRADASERQITNENELVDELEAYGFESYELASMSLVEQMALFSQADVVVGPHGAGLANITFCSDCLVVEIVGVKNRPTFLMQAQKLGIDYRLVIGQPDSNFTNITTDSSHLFPSNLNN